jgi:hypothetical protein
MIPRRAAAAAAVAWLASLAALLALAVSVAAVTAAGENVTVSDTTCAMPCPRCNRQSNIFTCGIAASPPDSIAVTKCLDKVLTSLPKGSIVASELRKLVLNEISTHSAGSAATGRRAWVFAGDRATGKTHMTKLLSPLFSTHYRDGSIAEGDALLELQCGDLAILPPLELQGVIEKLVVRHVSIYPRALIVVNDIQMCSSDTVTGMLAPLFEGTYFAKYPAVTLHATTFIATIDMEKDGATSGMSFDKLRDAVFQRIDNLFGPWVAQRTITVPFPVFGNASVRRAVLWHLDNKPCRMAQVRSLTYTTEVADWLFAQIVGNPSITTLNGRAVASAIEKHVDIAINIAVSRAHSWRTGDPDRGGGDGESVAHEEGVVNNRPWYNFLAPVTDLLVANDVYRNVARERFHVYLFVTKRNEVGASVTLT